jgi:acyl carrier protein
MVTQGLRERLAELIGRQTGTAPDALLADQAFAEMGFDSLAVLEIGFFLEQELHIDFGGKVTAQNLPRNLSDLEKLVLAHLPQAS